MTENEERQEAAGYFQKPSFNAKEKLVCSHLIEGINAEPLQTIIHTAQAALLLDGETLENLEIDKDLVLSLFTTAQRLSKPLIIQEGRIDPIYSLKLRTQNMEYDIDPWFTGKYRILGKPEEMQEFNEARREGTISREVNLNFITYRLSHEGYHGLVGDFLFYATPLIQQIGGKLAGTVSPESYLELFRLIKGEEP